MKPSKASAKSGAPARSRSRKPSPPASNSAPSAGSAATRRASALLILLGTVLVAVVTMAAGPIGFVALVAPHLARFLTGSPQPPLLVSGLTGSLLLAGADLLSQLVLESMPVSVVTNAVGGLYLMVALTVAAHGRRSL